jgi:cellulose synthase/poly-beta-1,6-N-acetylglucosamine synthase-like glycosyltransferase
MGCNKNPFVSIIIPCKEIDALVKRCVKACEELQYPHEILVIPDNTCPGFPSAKRNYASKIAQGEVLAYIDSDAYPRKDWLDNGIRLLKAGFVGVCGPGILPPDSPVCEYAIDLVYRVLPYNYRVIPKPLQLVPEFPTFNLIVWKKYVDAVDGFKDYLTGEDSLLCRDLRKYGDICYSPNIVVYHNRRNSIHKFIQQVATYGYHRGWLISQFVRGLAGTAISYPINFIRGLIRR